MLPFDRHPLLIEMGSFESRRLAPILHEPVYTLSIGPGGRLAVLGCGDGFLMTYDLGSGEIVQTEQVGESIETVRFLRDGELLVCQAVGDEGERIHLFSPLRPDPPRASHSPPPIAPRTHPPDRGRHAFDLAGAGGARVGLADGIFRIAPPGGEATYEWRAALLDEVELIEEGQTATLVIRESDVPPVEGLPLSPTRDLVQSLRALSITRLPAVHVALADLFNEPWRFHEKKIRLEGVTATWEFENQTITFPGSGRRFWHNIPGVPCHTERVTAEGIFLCDEDGYIGSDGEWLATKIEERVPIPELGESDKCMRPTDDDDSDEVPIDIEALPAGDEMPEREEGEYSVFLQKITGREKKKAVVRLLCELCEIDEHEAAERVDRMIVPIVKGVSKEYADKVLACFRKIGAIGRAPRMPPGK
ncbi:MAG: hypothetical protein HY720_01955 [Planctomycetes bacterium]|nr:hypothetical protein [Planctomycetota bacterium]